MEPVVIRLPFPPSLNNLFPTNRKTGRRFLSKEYRAWRKEALMMLMVARPQKFTCYVDAKIVLTAPTATRRDLDNYQKAAFDLLKKAGVIVDDSHIKNITASWGNELEPGAIVSLTQSADQRKPLTPFKRALLRSLQAEQYRLVSPGPHHKNILKLVAEGYVRELPGLIDGIPQGFAPVD